MDEDLLMRQIDAYAKRDYRPAHQLSYDAFAHVFVLAADAATNREHGRRSHADGWCPNGWWGDGGRTVRALT
jgi:hypothetical protein